MLQMFHVFALQKRCRCLSMQSRRSPLSFHRPGAEHDWLVSSSILASQRAEPSLSLLQHSAARQQTANSSVRRASRAGRANAKSLRFPS